MLSRQHNIYQNVGLIFTSCIYFLIPSLVNNLMTQTLGNLINSRHRFPLHSCSTATHMQMSDSHEVSQSIAPQYDIEMQSSQYVQYMIISSNKKFHTKYNNAYHKYFDENSTAVFSELTTHTCNRLDLDNSANNLHPSLCVYSPCAGLTMVE